MLPHETAQIIARWAARLAPPQCREDAEHEAYVGILTAAESFDPDKGASLYTYSRRRAIGAVQDYLRKMDPLTRDHRKLVREGTEPAIRYVQIDALPGVESHERSIVRRLTVQTLVRRTPLSPRQRGQVLLTLAGMDGHRRTVAAARRRILKLAA